MKHFEMGLKGRFREGAVPLGQAAPSRDFTKGADVGYGHGPGRR